jgi:thiosulfate dehydrogenase (quinone) large subunit
MFTETFSQRIIIFLFRISMGWVFLGAALRQIPNPDWSAAGFMSNSPNLTWFFQTMSEPPFIGLINFIIPWAHLLLGIALILGIFMRLSAIGGGLLMFLYYIPRFDFPSVIVEYHLVYTGILVYLALVRAGQIYGIENWVSNFQAIRPFLERHPFARKAMG